MQPAPQPPSRLPRKHDTKQSATADDGARLIANQKPLAALVSALIAIVVFAILWAMFSTLVDKVFPWMTLALGIGIGLVIRRAGDGVDWRFPTIAAVTTLIGALLANILVAAAFAAIELETSTITVLRSVTSMTWSVFFQEVINAVDLIYALFAAALAAYFANRKLSRAEYLALRRYREHSEKDSSVKDETRPDQGGNPN